MPNRELEPRRAPPQARRSNPIRACGALLAASLLAPFASAASAVDIEAIRATKRVTAVRVTEPIQLDGRLDDAAWQLAEPAADFYQQQPAEFELATRRTSARFLYDDTTLYVGVMLYDPEPGQLIVNELRRDFNGRDGDGFGLILDTFEDRRNCYGFLTNPGGAQRESQAYDNGRRNDANWHGVWFVETSIGPDGWSAEYAIPFKTLRFPEGETQQWGLNLVRFARRANETSTWAPVPRQFSHYNVAYAGTLVGIARPERGRNLQIKPFATGQVDFDQQRGPGWESDGDGGIDLKWGLTSSLLLDATWRTDFSQVEADDQQVNLTRFGLFFPEKREFFLEGQSAFQIGLVEPNNEDPRRDLEPFFSRRIGLSPDGRPVPVLGGLRLTGRMGPHGVGVLNMQTRAFAGQPAENFSAVRISRDVTSTATVAGFYFGREASGSASFNRVGGLDLRLRPTNQIEIEAFAMGSATHAAPGGWAGRVGFRLDTNAHRARVGFLHIDDSFVHDLGYVRRRGIGTAFGRYQRILRPARTGSPIREFSLTADVEATSDDRYERILTRVLGLRFGTLFADGGELKARATTSFERIDSSFEVGPELSVQPGEYSFEDGGIEYASDKSARLSGSVELGAGEYWSGRQRLAAASMRLRLDAHVAASATFSRSTITLPEGAFTADLLGLKLDWSFTPRMFLNAFVQYNSETDAWISNVRFNLIHRPLSDIYVVWNETRLPGLIRRAVLFKYTHLVSF